MTETPQGPRPEANDVLMGSGYPAIKFDQLRVWVGGTIVTKPTTRQETEFGTGKPRTFPKSGDPIYGLLVDVQTDERTDAEDNGVRRMYIEGRLLKEAVKNAVIASGAPGLQQGGKLFVAYVGDGVPASAGAHAPKLYEARYYPSATPVPSASIGSMSEPMGEPGAPAPAVTHAGTVSALVQPAPMSAPAGTFAPMPESSPAPAFADAQNATQSPRAEDYVRSTAAAVGTSEPTAEAIAALRAAGLDPQTVFPNYQG